ncbi:TPA: carboxylating nicotinate-nucleotide diphosphorylase [bacterium]|nr:carboxylating nicotinate-nucleotide diphosphorylase [bacterium]
MLSIAISDLIDLALREDIGTGDITSESTIPENVMAKAIILSKDEGIIAGLDIAGEVFHKIDPNIDYKKLISDGDMITKKQEIAIVEGKARSLLTAERTVLNFIQRLSGVATITSRYAKAVSGYKAKIVDTRKTTPGWRALEKYAVRIGGGGNHRFGLYDAVLIKDNHIAVAGSITEAIARAKKQIPHTIKIEVETENLDQVQESIQAKADIIMLDNMTIDMMSKAVKLIDGKAIVEASGGIKLENVASVAETGVDLISIGAITHSAISLDISMDIILR